MTVYIYDGSFAGLLSAVFSSFHLKETPSRIAIEQQLQLGLLKPLRLIKTDPQWAERVLTGIDARTDQRASLLVYKMFLSEMTDIENVILGFIQKIITHDHPSVLQNFADEYVQRAMQVNKMIDREVHRMHAFVRFKKTSENTYCAEVDPDFNVLPLLGEHFAKRYADQRWIILDTRRRCALLYDLQEAVVVSANSPVFESAAMLPRSTADSLEDHYQDLWKQYFNAVNIQERRNPRLHLRHMPKRYWKYLIEKKA